MSFEPGRRARRGGVRPLAIAPRSRAGSRRARPASPAGRPRLRSRRPPRRARPRSRRARLQAAPRRQLRRLRSGRNRPPPIRSQRRRPGRTRRPRDAASTTARPIAVVGACAAAAPVSVSANTTLTAAAPEHDRGQLRSDAYGSCKDVQDSFPRRVPWSRGCVVPPSSPLPLPPALSRPYRPRPTDAALARRFVRARRPVHAARRGCDLDPDRAQAGRHDDARAGASRRDADRPRNRDRDGAQAVTDGDRGRSQRRLLRVRRRKAERRAPSRRPARQPAFGRWLRASGSWPTARSTSAASRSSARGAGRYGGRCTS